MTSPTPFCVALHLDHTCIAVSSLEEAIRFYQDTFDLSPGQIEEVPDQGVRATLLQVGKTCLELIESTDPTNAIARFIQKRGEALHHMCFQVEDLQGTLTNLEQRGIRLIDRVPRKGLAGRIAFLHPGSTRGVLIELVESESA